MIDRSKKLENRQKYFKTFRFNNQNNMDAKLNEISQNYNILNESTSAFYIPLRDLPQNLPLGEKNKVGMPKADKNYLKANPALQPIQFVCTIMYTNK